MKVLCFGDRNWDDEGKVREVLKKLPKDTIIIHGACRGADNISGNVAISLGMRVMAYPAQWQLGRAAGPIRNQTMLKAGPDKAFCFHSDLSRSRGSKDMLQRLNKAGIPVEIIE